MTKINKVMCILFILLGMILFNSCPDPDPSYVNIYPSNIEIPNIGTLKYSHTLWDGKNKGTDIYDATKIDGEIWVLASTNDLYLYKGINKSNTILIKSIDGTPASDYWGYGRHEIVTKGDFILLFASRYEYEPIGKWKYYYMRINRNSRNIQYFDFSNSFEYNYGVDINLFHRNNEVFLVIEAYDHSSKSFFTLNNDCNMLIETDEESFNNYVNQNKNTVYIDNNGKYSETVAFTMDDNDIFYRIYSEFQVSVDNGETWYTCDLGTNIPVSIIIQNNDIYVFCHAESKWVSSWGTKSVGGGIHVFRWK